MSNITYLFPLYARISSTILKFLQGFWKLAVFLLLLTKFTLFLKSTSFLLVNFPKLIFNQKKKSGFIWFKTFDILFQKLQTFIQKKRVVPWKLLLLNFKNIGRNNLQFLQNLWKINMNINFFTGIFLYFFYYFVGTPILRKSIEMATSIYFNREASQKCENATLQTNLRGVLISWRKYLFNSK